MNDRPHPGLLPQEKENRSPVSGNADAPGCRAAFSANDKAMVMTRRTSMLSRDADWPTLSSGERAGVRASQTHKLHFFNGRSEGERKTNFSFFLLHPAVSSAWCSPAVDAARGLATHGRSCRGWLVCPGATASSEAKFLDAHRNKELGSFSIVSLLAGLPVPAAVEFDGEAGFAAVKIQKVNPDRMPPTKFVGAESPVTQPTPHEFFRPSRLLAQRAGAVGVGHGRTVGWCGCEEKNRLNARPHPGLLPQEKENRSPRFDDADAPVCPAAFSANDKAMVMTRRASRLSRDADSSTLSSGRGSG